MISIAFVEFLHIVRMAELHTHCALRGRSQQRQKAKRKEGEDTREEESTLERKKAHPEEWHKKKGRGWEGKWREWGGKRRNKEGEEKSPVL